MGNPLFATKSLDTLMKEASDTGEHSLKRALGPANEATRRLAKETAMAV